MLAFIRLGLHGLHGLMKFSNVICMFLVGLLISIVSCCKRSVDDVMNDSIPEAKRLRSCDDVDENVDANYPILVDALRNEIDFERDLLYGGFERSMVSSIAYFVSTYPDGVDEEGNNVLNFALLNGMSQSIMSLIIRYGRYSAILPNKAGYTPLFNLLQWTTEIYLFELNRKFSKNHIFSPLLFANRDLRNMPGLSFRDIPFLAIGKHLDQSYIKPPSQMGAKGQKDIEERLKGLGYL